MNNTFNLKRFSFFFRKILLENKWQIAGVFLGAVVFYIMLFTPLEKSLRYWDTFSELILKDSLYHEAGNRGEKQGTILFIFGAVWAYFLFGYFGTKEKGFNYILLPVSVFEKWLLGVLSVFIFILFAFFAFSFVDFYFIQQFLSSLENTQDTYSLSFLKNNIRYYHLTDKDVLLTISATLSLTALSAIGAIKYNKNAVVKILLSLLGLFIFTMLFDDAISDYIFSDTPEYLSSYFGALSIRTTVPIYLPKNWAFYNEIAFVIVLPIILWFVALLALKEKEL